MLSCKVIVLLSDLIQKQTWTQTNLSPQWQLSDALLKLLLV